MADSQDREPVGSVAEETARLLDALGAWAERGYAARPPHEEGSRDAEDGTSEARCEHCGGDSSPGEALACQLCPICQGIAFLRAVRPETVDRLADLVAALARTLREVAAERGGAAERRGAEGSAPPPPGGHRVQDISVEDEDAAGAEPAGDGRSGPAAPDTVAADGTVRDSDTDSAGRTAR